MRISPGGDSALLGNCIQRLNMSFFSIDDQGEWRGGNDGLCSFTNCYLDVYGECGVDAQNMKPGQERFGNMTRVYYKEAVGAFVVFDVSRGSTFEAVLKWKSDLDSKVHLPNGSPIPAVLLANKCDQKKDGGQNPPQMDQFCKEHGFSGWFETSAKDNINIDEAARFLVENILANHQSFPSEEIEGSIKLDPETLKKENKPQCC
ncbi:ras-related protein Rab-32 [Camelus ferus]|nr:ras-related protein Rab-32 [Camelus ferus]